eukprot:CAMPEP_0197627104 /NCGR_PEP_ID=MMETSP1338-20131121/5808_1 /TAXON_ID=43686 ORGANISM="Pelagodinium beii, Strain RCC1491" /NCGR_SAMPLE_ID=MMETSP1338 /ASSEMBLY_ACC=CAM_ASM_000754 /LENGTH=304 /DNA_ID=CAMNT_0043197727 /DNA_START=131 /DNA_END=1045 /DNA_ORIENTATION=+
MVTREKKDDNSPQLQEEDEDGDLIFDQTPVKVACPHCGVNIITFIEHESSWVTFAVCLVLFMVLNWAALCIVPVVYPLFKDVVHHCPRCLRILATRSRVVLPSLKDEVMSFRFGSCAMVLARKYVLALLAMMMLIGSIHWIRSSNAPATGIDAVERGEISNLRWDDFVKDCGFKSYLGNPIHVTVAFEEKFKNNTFLWSGTAHRVEEGFSFLGFSQRGAIFVDMDPQQFPTKRDLADLVLLYKEGDVLTSQVSKLKKGDKFQFTATMLEVGRRGQPHVMVLWELNPGVADVAGMQSAASNKSAP